MIAAIAIGGYLWEIHNTTPDQYAGPFINNHVPFSLYRNVLLPDIGMGLLIYGAYMVITLFTIPRLIFPQKFEAGTSKASISITKMKLLLQGMAGKVVKEYAWLIIQLLLIAFVLGTALNAAVYYKHEWQFHYPGFSIFFNSNSSNAQINVYSNYLIILVMMALYSFYVCVREAIIHFIERPDGRRGYRILICNQITLVTIEYLLVPFFLVSFHFISSYKFYLAYFLMTPSLLLMFMSNLYWLFPFKKEKSFFYRPVLIRLSLTALLCSLPFLFFVHEGHWFGFVFCMAVQLFIITPISWLAYQRKKDELQLLRGAEKVIAKSKTDLQFLRSQINPHFLFNVLNTLYGTALQENAERTASGIQKLGDMMRFMLHENNQDFIDMNKEIEYLKNYIALQKLRTQSSSDIIIEENIIDQNCHHKIAPMLLIPLVENAFKHGISLKEKSWIQINLECNEKNILFEVRNSMHPRRDNDPEEERSGIGFKNVIERLKLIYGGKFQISVNGDGKEFFVQLAIQP
jgi:hypothetical protein